MASLLKNQQRTRIPRVLSRRAVATSGIPISRRGNILVLTAFSMVLVFGFAAFAVDVGYIALTRSQMQSSSDAIALAAGQDLIDGLGADPELTPSQVVTAATSSGVLVANSNPSGGRSTTFVQANRDIEFGRRTWNSTTQTWTEDWGTGPYNMVRVTAHRDQPSTSANDGALPLFFAPVIGTNTAQVTTTATAAIMPASAIRVRSGCTENAPILPIAYDLQSWNSFINGTSGPDNYRWTPDGCESGSSSNNNCGSGSSNNNCGSGSSGSGSSGSGSNNCGSGSSGGSSNSGSGCRQTTVRCNGSFRCDGTLSSGSDGIREFDLYPYGNQALTSGNRGCVDLGNSNNSTNDLKRQIEFGLNASDLSYFPNNTIKLTNGQLLLNGDTGISAGIKSALEAIIGQTRLIPIFSSVSGPGNNATYTVVNFVGVRILAVQLTGGNKKVVVQPAPVQDRSLVYDGSSTPFESVFTPLQLIR